MTPKTPILARLFVLLARNAPVGVILRRGPSDWVQMIQWHTKTDVFKQGQWFTGGFLNAAAIYLPMENISFIALSNREIA